MSTILIPSFAVGIAFTAVLFFSITLYKAWDDKRAKYRVLSAACVIAFATALAMWIKILAMTKL